MVSYGMASSSAQPSGSNTKGRGLHRGGRWAGRLPQASGGAGKPANVNRRIEKRRAAVKSTMKKLPFLPSMAAVFAGALLLAGCASPLAQPPPRTTSLSQSWARAYPTLKDLTQSADAIVVGTVAKSAPAAAVDGIPFTDATVAVKSWLKGTTPAATITVRQTGGALKDSVVVAEGDAIMQPGEEAMLFLQKNDDGTYVALSGPTGRLPVSGMSVKKMPDTSLTEVIPETLPELIAAVKRLL